MNSKKIFIFILGLIITIGSVYWTLNKINLDITKSIISDIGSTNFILLSVIYIFGFLPRGLRSKIMLSPMAYVDFKNAFYSVVVGYSFNSFLPFRIGEIIRSYYLKKKLNISVFSCFSSVALERILDAIILIILLFLSLYFINKETISNVYEIAFTISFLLASIVFLITLAFIFKNKILIFSKKFLNDIFTSIIVKVLESFKFINNSISLIKISLLTLIIWLIEGMMYVYLADCLGIPNPLLIGYFCLGVVSIGILIPSSPGHIGVFEVSIILAFQILGLDASLGAAYAIAIHFTQLITILGMGILIAPKAMKDLNIKNVILKKI